MCLSIDTTKHKKLFGYCLPKIAFKNIYVYKGLECSTTTGIYLTPYQKQIVEFKNGKCVLKSFFSFKPDILNDPIRVCKGIHAYTKTKYSIDFLTFPAVIPKGSLYYIGDHDDIVSTKLVIYKNLP